MTPFVGRDRILLLVQPRPLSPQENVALDDWVRAGGRVVLFVDPMLTQHSRFAPGDPRRPEDIAMLSPILARWGLELRYDEAQDPAPRVIALAEGSLPVRLAGHFGISGKSGEVLPGDACALEAGGVLARCRIGFGHVVAIADAAVFERSDGGDAAGRRALLARILAGVAPGRH